jgi:RNA polymerase sigma-70 factor (ECF subfamily)
VACIVYKELHRLAAAAIPWDARDRSLQPTLLVNEAFLRLLKGEPVDWHDRDHFFHLAARMMRRIVVDHFKERGAKKRPPARMQLSLDDVAVFNEDSRDEALMVDQALEGLSNAAARAAKVVELRYFGGLTIDQIASILEISDQTVKRDCQFARWWFEKYYGIPHHAAAQ